ncbi:hypothetical protein, partial [Mesorhizobium sp. P5_C1]
VSQMFPGPAPDWSKVSTPEDFQAAVTWALAAQQELGFDRKLPLPRAVSSQRATQYIDPSVPFEKRFAELSAIVLAVRDPGARKAVAEQISLAAQAQWRARAAQDSNITPELLEAQLAELKNGLAWIGEHPARAQYSTMPLLQQFGLAFGDVGRLTAKGGTAGGADAISAGLDSALSGGSYEDLLKKEQTRTEDAEDRAGSARWAAEALGAGLTGYGLAKGVTALLGWAGIGEPPLGARRVALTAAHPPTTLAGVSPGGLPMARFGVPAAMSLPKGLVQLAARCWQGSPSAPALLNPISLRIMGRALSRQLVQKRFRFRLARQTK